MSLKSRFAREVYRKRHLLGLTQWQIANELMISVKWYQVIELGKRLPGSTLTLRIIALLEINGKDLQEVSETTYV